MIGPDTSAHRPDSRLCSQSDDTQSGTVVNLTTQEPECSQFDDTNGGIKCDEQAEGPHHAQIGETANTIRPTNRVIGVPFRSGDDPRRAVNPRKLNPRIKYAAQVRRIIKRAEWRAVVRTMYRIATDEKSRQAVAAASWISDRVMGPLAQQIALDVTSGGESIEDKRQRLYARAAEMGMPINVTSRPADALTDSIIPPQ